MDSLHDDLMYNPLRVPHTPWYHQKMDLFGCPLVPRSTNIWNSDRSRCGAGSAWKECLRLRCISWVLNTRPILRTQSLWAFISINGCSDMGAARHAHQLWQLVWCGCWVPRERSVWDAYLGCSTRVTIPRTQKSKVLCVDIVPIMGARHLCRTARTSTLQLDFGRDRSPTQPRYVASHRSTSLGCFSLAPIVWVFINIISSLTIR